MENPFGRNARTARKGHKNFLNCMLKETGIVTHSHGNNVLYSYVKAVLETCPSLEDRGEKGIWVENSRTTEQDAIATRDAMDGLARTCGAAICANCVYVNMETPIEVSKYRVKRAEAAREALVAEKALISAQREIAAIEAGAGLTEHPAELHIVSSAEAEMS